MERYPMRKKLVNEKRDELKSMSRTDFIDRICSYPNQALLNQDEEGVGRDVPVGKIAQGIRDRNYRMSDLQYYLLIHNFAGITVPDMKVVGVTFRHNNAGEFERKLIAKDGPVSVYDTTYTLIPEPTNPYDKNAVKVMAHKENGDLHHLGYLSRDFVAAHPITESIEIHGNFTDHSNGRFKNVSYSLPVDIEPLDRQEVSMMEYTDADLHGVGDLSLDQPEHPGLDHYVYETPFQLVADVLDFDAAKDWLVEESRDMNDILQQSIQQDAATGNGVQDFSSKIEQVEWSLYSDHAGIITITANEKLDNAEQAFISEWIQSQNSDGLGEAFEQQSFAEHTDEDERYVIDRASFDYVSNPYTLTQISGPNMGGPNHEQADQQTADYLKSATQTAVDKQNLQLSESDLDFARQMTLAEFGLE